MFGVVFFCIILHAISVWCSLFGVVFFCMTLFQKLQAHCQVYANGNLVILQKDPGRQAVFVLFSTEESRKRSQPTLRVSAELIRKKKKKQKQKDATWAGPKWDFLPHPTNLHPLTIKAPSKDKKISKIMLPAFPSSVFHTKFTTSNLKSK